MRSYGRRVIDEVLVSAGARCPACIALALEGEAVFAHGVVHAHDCAAEGQTGHARHSTVLYNNKHGNGKIAAEARPLRKCRIRL